MTASCLLKRLGFLNAGARLNLARFGRKLLGAVQEMDVEGSGKVTTTELFDLDADPWELKNVAGAAPAALLAELHARLRAYYPCRGASCP